MEHVNKKTGYLRNNQQGRSHVALFKDGEERTIKTKKKTVKAKVKNVPSVQMVMINHKLDFVNVEDYVNLEDVMLVLKKNIQAKTARRLSGDSYYETVTFIHASTT